MTTSTQSAYNPIAFQKLVFASDIATTRWLYQKKVMCWSCQKEFPRNEGHMTSVVKRTGSRITQFNAGNKFVCFKCKPEKAV